MQRFETAQAFLDHLAEVEFEGLDHIHSPLTRALVDTLNANGVRLNKWWICTPTTWHCPCCQRDKAAIARLDSKGALCGELHSHHDHLGDYFREVVNSSEVLEPNEKSLMIQRLGYALSLFPRTIICPDCNALEGQAKIAVNAEPCFTFSPREIRQFIQVTEQSITLDQAVAKQVYSRSVADFNLRQQFGHQLIRLYHRHPIHEFDEWTEKKVTARAHTILRNYDVKDIHQNIYSMAPVMAGISDEKVVDDSWRRASFEPNERPITEQAKQELLSHETRSRHWRKVADDWHCPLCERSKQDCLKWNKHRQLSFTIGKLELLLNEGDETPVEWQVCSDCQHHNRQLKQELIDADIYSPLYAQKHLTLHMLQLSFTAIAHNKHQPDNEFIDFINDNP